MEGILKILGKNGRPYTVDHGIGLGVRQHDDVMLAYGYSRKVSKIFTVPAGEYALITMTIPADLNHHAESRFVEAYNGSLEFKLITGLTEAQVTTGTKEQISAFNKKGMLKDDNVSSIFHYRGVTADATDPLDGLYDEDNTPDDYVIRGSSGQGNQASIADAFASVKGRYYYEGIITVWMYNPNGSDIEVTYEYDWHEF